jgi:spore coat protein U-like protein
MRGRVRAALMSALVLAASPTWAYAQTPEGTHSCTIDATGVAFGSVTGLSEARTTGTVAVVCNGNGANNPLTVSLSSGTGSFALRTMRRGTSVLRYNLFSDSAATQIWGDGTGGSTPVTLVFNFQTDATVTQMVTVFAVLPAQTPPAPGAYTDLIVVTVNF